MNVVEQPLPRTLLRPHVLRVDARDDDRLLHRVTAEGLAKLDRTNGTLDTAFSPATMNPGSGFSAYTVAIDGDSLFAGGYFTSYRGKPALGTVRVDLSTGEAR